MSFFRDLDFRGLAIPLVRRVLLLLWLEFNGTFSFPSPVPLDFFPAMVSQENRQARIFRVFRVSDLKNCSPSWTRPVPPRADYPGGITILPLDDLQMLAEPHMPEQRALLQSVFPYQESHTKVFFPRIPPIFLTILRELAPPPRLLRFLFFFPSEALFSVPPQHQRFVNLKSTHFFSALDERFGFPDEYVWLYSDVYEFAAYTNAVSSSALHLFFLPALSWPAHIAPPPLP